MKNLKRIFFAFILMFSMGFCLLNVNAISEFPQSFVGNSGENLIGSSYGASWQYHFKSSTNKYLVYCVGIWNSGWSDGNTYVISNDWSTPVSAGVAAIIEKVVGVDATTNVSKNDYYISQMAIWKFLQDKSGISQPGDVTTLEKNIELIQASSNATLFNNAIDAANAAYTRASEGHSITLSSNLLQFTLDGDFYVSNKIIVSGINMDTVSAKIVSAPTATSIVGDANSGFIVKVPKSALTAEVTEVSINFESKGTVYYLAANYDCSSCQATTLSTLKPSNELDSKTISGSIEKEKVAASIKIGKVDENNNYIEAASLMLQTESQKKAGEAGTIYISENKLTEIKNLEVGKYYLSEKAAPEGYIKSDKVIEIEIKEDGSVYIDGKKSSTVEIKVSNSKNRIEISKITTVNGKELEGAKLSVLNSKQEKMACTIIDTDGKEKLLEDCTWVSGKTSTIIVGLSVGEYYLKEIIAPEGYALSEEMVKFEIKENQELTKVEMKNSPEVPVPDTLSSRSTLLITIAMFNIALGIGVLVYVKKNKLEQ